MTRFGYGEIARNEAVSIDDILNAAQAGALSPAKQTGRRRRKALARQAGKASLLAPLLAAEGCLTFRPEDVNLGAPTPEPEPTPMEPSGGGAFDDGNDSLIDPNADKDNGGPVTPEPRGGIAANDTGLEAQAGEALMIAPADLLANDGPASAQMSVVRVFGAENGTVMFMDGMIHFTPDDGFEGVASFQYEINDGNGGTSIATVEIMVDGEGGHDDGHDMGHHDGGHDDNNGGGHDDGMGHDGGGHGHGDPNNPHPDDPSKHAEHMAALALAPIDQATHIAVNDGSWFDPNTWAGGEVPGEGAQVLISKGVTVAYDGESPASLYTVRVDGELNFATDQNTFMEVDTFLVAPDGVLTIGTLDDPVAPGVEAVIQIADNGPIDVAWDPMLLSRGLISHGDISVHGAEKDAFLQVSVDPMAGDTQMTLSEVPDGWQVGDKIVLAGTHLTDAPWVENGVEQNLETQDEELIITGINGNVIQFDRPLQYDHDAPRDDLKTYVANYSRNVRIQTENADDIPVHQRGHTMFMHSDDVDVRYAEFLDLGRTDKSERSFSVTDVDNVAADTNAKARYAVHLHRTGVSELDDPAILVGNSVWGSPGWGFVHHDSNAIMTDNAAYDVFGAAFVAETGNETGRWANNIAIKSIGIGGTPKDQPDINAFDLGRTGVGFWFQGRLVDSVDNIAAGMPSGHGFVYMSRGANGDVIALTPDIADQPETFRYLDEANINVPNISGFSGNVAFAVETGVEIIKATPEQGHDGRSLISDFTAWEVRTGVHLQYTAHYTLEDIDVINTKTPLTLGHLAAGIEYGPNTFDVVVNGATIDGFPVGIRTGRSIVNFQPENQIEHEYVFIDVEFVDTPIQFNNPDDADRILSSNQLIITDLSFESDIADFTEGPFVGDAPLTLSGEKTDSLGTVNIAPIWDSTTDLNLFSFKGAAETEGYWTLPDGRRVTLFEQYFSDRVTGELDKVGVFLVIPEEASVEALGNFLSVEPEYHGVLDLTNVAPTARDDAFSTDAGISARVNLIGNDTDADGDPLSIDGLVQPEHGFVTDNGDGTVTYNPDPNYVGTDEFAYWVEDDAGNFDKALVQVTVEI